MTYLTARFADQQSAMMAMDRLIGRGLGHARVLPLVERPSEPNVQPASPADLGRARLELQIGEGASEGEVRTLLLELGATDLTTSDETEHPFPADAPVANAQQREDIARAVAASERGATGSGVPPQEHREEFSPDDKRTKHDPHR